MGFGQNLQRQKLLGHFLVVEKGKKGETRIVSSRYEVNSVKGWLV